MAEVLLLHHAQGLTPGVVALADRLIAAGHVVHTPDVYDGRTFDELSEGLAYLGSIGFQTAQDRGIASAEGLPDDLVYIGLSLGVMAVEQLVLSRPGARAAVFMGSAVRPGEFGGEWPAGVPVQIHGTEGDPVFVGEGDIDAARDLVRDAGAELFLYPGDGHLFVDNSLSDYDEDATELFLERVLGLLQRVE
jgi:dienelactone hydrolase